MVLEQQETTGFLKLVGCCVIEIPGELGACFRGRSIDYLVVSKNFRHCVRNVRVDKSAPWSAHVAIALLRRPSKILSRQLVSPSPLTPVAPCQCKEEWLKRYRVAQSALPRNSPQEASVAYLLRPAVSDSLAPNGRWPRSATSSPCARWKGPRDAVGVAVVRGQLPVFHLRPIHLKRVDEHAAEWQGHLFKACVQGRLLEVKR